MEIQKLILASTSPFRSALLASTGLTFSTCNSKVDETKIQSADPSDLARQRSEAKALAASDNYPSCIVIGADQVASFENLAFDKAESHDEAEARLRQLSGQTHFLHSAYSLVYRPHGEKSIVLRSRIVKVGMTMRKLTDTHIIKYLETEEWRGCVGCYRVEGRGMHLFEKIDRDQSSVIGLPLHEILSDLRTVGIDGLLNATGPWKLHRPPNQPMDGN